MTLTEFLLARIEEDEEVAYANIEPPPGYRPRSEDDPLILGARRVLAECDAKRRIVADLATMPLAASYVFRALALPYAAHPDYRSEWRPQ